jgi:carbon monoxide dehydrogenase subunit G
MARYRTSIDSDLSPAEAFASLARFSSAAEWDPGVVEAEDLTGGPLRVGSAFRLVVKVLGRRMPLRYEITEMETDRRVVLEAPSSTFRSVDEITFEPRGTGTRVTYDADLRLRGLARIADPLLRLAFRRIGDAAAAGLREHLRASHARRDTSS